MAATFPAYEKHSRATTHTKTQFPVLAMSHAQVFEEIAPVVIKYSVDHHCGRTGWTMDKHYCMRKGPLCYEELLDGKCACCRARRVLNENT